MFCRDIFSYGTSGIIAFSRIPTAPGGGSISRIHKTTFSHTFSSTGSCRIRNAKVSLRLTGVTLICGTTPQPEMTTSYPQGIEYTGHPEHKFASPSFSKPPTPHLEMGGSLDPDTGGPENTIS